jgi:hypothetical protein
MPIIRIYGAGGAKEFHLQAITNLLKDGIARIKELAVSRNEVSVFFPSDCVTARADSELVVYVEMFNRENRTPAVRKKAAAAVGEILDKGFPDTQFIEVLPMSYDSEGEGYWSLRREDQG